MPDTGDLVVWLLWLAVAAVAAAVVLAYRARQIGVVVGLLFAAASFSRITAPVGSYAVRLEQPALVILLVTVAFRERDAVRRVVAENRWLVAGAALYLGANLASSVLYAARPIDSLRIAGWLVLSLLGGLAIAAIVARAPRAAGSLSTWIVGAAALQVAVGVAAVLSEALFRTTWGVQATDVVLGKTYGLSWEANLLAINLAMALALVIVPHPGLRLGEGARLAVVGWLGIGLGLAYSRGGAVALAAGLAATGLAIAAFGRKRPLPSLRQNLVPLLGPTIAAFAAVFLTIGSLDLLASRGVGWTALPPAATAAPTPGEAPSPSVGSPTPATATPAVSVAPSEAPATPGLTGPPASSPPPHVGTGDTIAVRLDNIWLALRETAQSPLIGLGTDSFAQRHIEPSCACPAAISNMLVAAVHDSGVAGLVGLCGLLAGVLFLAWRRGERAYFAALLVLIIGYQATDALRFASNWILIGAVIGLAAQRPSQPTP